MCCQIFDGKSDIHQCSECRRGRPIDKIRKKKKIFVNFLLDSFGSRGRTAARGSLREFFISCPPLKICVQFIDFPPNFFFEILKTLKVNSEKLHPDLSYY